MVSQMAKLKGLYNVLNHVPERLHKVDNRMGDSISRQVADFRMSDSSPGPLILNKIKEYKIYLFIMRSILKIGGTYCSG